MDLTDLFCGDEARPTAKIPEWCSSCDFGLLTAETLPAFVDECIASGEFSQDLETTGLDKRVFKGRTVDDIVGMSFSPDGKRARYVPIRHKGAGEQYNVPWSVVSRELRRLQEAMLARKTVADLFNGGYDQEMMTFAGDPEPFDPWEEVGTWKDGLMLAFLADPTRKKLGLKALSASELGMEMIKLEDLFPAESTDRDFSHLDPCRTDVLAYACSDAIAHYRIVRHFEPKAREPVPGHRQDGIIRIEQLCLLATRWMVRNRVGIDREKVRQLIELGQREWVDATQAFYQEASEILGRNVAPGAYQALFAVFRPDVDRTIDQMLDECKTIAVHRYGPDPTEVVVKGAQEFPPVYEVTSPQQLGDLLTELGVPGLRETEKKTQVDTSKEEIERIAEEHGEKFPFVKKVRTMRQAGAAITNWLHPLYSECDADGSGAFPFKQFGTETGRFASPQDKNLSRRRIADVPSGWPPMNFQNISTPRKERPQCMNRTREGIRGRPCPCCGKQRLNVSVDMSGVEARIVTNMAGEPKWIDAFFTCAECNLQFDRGDGTATPEAPPPRCPRCGSDRIGDIHASTAIEVLGAKQSDSDWKDKRGKAKTMNYAVLYGGGGEAVCRALGTSDKNEGWRIKKKFDEKHQGLKRWWDAQHALARDKGGVFDALGRFIPTPGITDTNSFIRSLAERNSTNGPAQATSATLTKLAMGLIYKEFRRRGWLDRAPLIACMHDELVFEMCPSIMEEAIDVVIECLGRNAIVLRLRWIVPLTNDVEIGTDWSVPWNLTEMRAGEVRFAGNKKYKSREAAQKDGHDWDAMPNFPECLRPYFKRQDLGYKVGRGAVEVQVHPGVPLRVVLRVPELSPLWVERAAAAVVAVGSGGGDGAVPLQLEHPGGILTGWAEDEVRTTVEAAERAARTYGLAFRVEGEHAKPN